jgi:ParB family chromosome partitioning protein
VRPLVKDQLSRLFHFGDKLDTAEEVKYIPVDQITSSPYQPRSVFDDDRIDELSQTIRTHGVIQPIVVRKTGSSYQLIAGERRWRAAKKIGMATIPAIVREMSDTQAASVALIENLQREGLTAIEEALAYQQLIELHGLTQESLAQRLGKGQSTVANKLRLLHLPEDVQEALMQRKISERHARAMLGLPSKEMQLTVLHEVIAKELNVKQTEERIKQLLSSKPNVSAKNKSRRVAFARDIRLAVNTIRQSLNMITQSGLPVTAEEQDREDYYEIVIRIAKRK